MTAPELLADLIHAPDTWAVAHGDVVVRQMVAVAIEDRTIVILRDEDLDEDGVAGWMLLDTEMGNSDWTLPALRHWVTELEEDPGMAGYQADVNLWRTVLALVEKAAT